jgi:hypothetical protein
MIYLHAFYPYTILWLGAQEPYHVPCYEVWMCIGAVVGSTGEPPYPRIQYPRFQLSAIFRGPKKFGKLKK